tara:strand:+ start:295 stop:1563 length:1269 start_codon:yes stop_codon:yes gene_type:complete
MKIYFTYGHNVKDKKKKEQNIIVRLSYGRNKLQVKSSTRISITKESWNFKNGEQGNIVDLLKGSRTPNESEYLQEAKEKLDRIRNHFKNEFRKLKLKAEFHVMDSHDWNKWAKEELDIALGIKEAKNKLAPFFLKLYEDWEDLNRNTWSTNTKADYKSIKKKFEAYEKYKKQKYKTNEIDLTYFMDFQNWCYNIEHLKPNTFNGYIAKLRAITNHYRTILPAELFHKQLDHKKFRTIDEPVPHEILDEDELKALWSYKGSDKLENVRDISKLLYFVCLRYNEFEYEFKTNKEKPLKIAKSKDQYYWAIYERKVRDSKGIPLDEELVKMYEANEMPHFITNQKFDKYIKELCIEVGLEKKAQYISAHTLRRSFCTNMYNEGHDEKDIIEYSGHSTVKALRNYIKTKNVTRKNSIANRKNSKNE